MVNILVIEKGDWDIIFLYWLYFIGWLFAERIIC